MRDVPADGDSLPVLALRGTVLLPGVTASVVAGRTRSLNAIAEALESDHRLFAVAQQDPSGEEPTPDRLYRVGTICEVRQPQRGDRSMHLTLRSLGRARARRFEAQGEGADAHLSADIEPLAEQPLEDGNAEHQALVEEVREAVRSHFAEQGTSDRMLDNFFSQAESPSQLADLVAFYVEDIPVESQQEILALTSVEERLRALLTHLVEIDVRVKARNDIRGRVRERIGEQQRERFLREQMRAIRSELGEEDGAGASQELRERLDDAALPDEAHEEAVRGIARLERLPMGAPQYGMVRTHVETLLELPWNQHADSTLSLDTARAVLERDHHGLDDVKERVLDYLGVLRLRRERPDRRPPPGVGGDAAPRQGSILLFAGPPGVGKTSVARSIAEAMGRPYVRVALGGVRDEADIRGHRRTYMGAIPGRIMQGIRDAGARNPVFLLDELDKVGRSVQGDPGAALMEVLDPAQNHAFVDHYVGVPFDLSDVLFIGTANVLDAIPGPLRDRLEVVPFRGYTEREKRAIALEHLLPRQVYQQGLTEDDLWWAEDVIGEVIRSYTREAGVRQLERHLGTLTRKVARRLASGDPPPIRVEGDLREELGRRRARSEDKLDEPTIGMATGLYYADTGGDIMFVEASVFPGPDDYVLTGQLGDVMQESARAALTYARSHAATLGVPADLFGDNEIHLHVPAGAVPKEGPSAGIAMTVALVSALTDRPVRDGVAMSGEITLTGRVLPVGGIREKVLGAHRAGVRTIVLPADNEDDLEDLPAEVRSSCTFCLVERLEEALAVALHAPR